MPSNWYSNTGSNVRITTTVPHCAGEFCLLDRLESPRLWRHRVNCDVIYDTCLSENALSDLGIRRPETTATFCGGWLFTTAIMLQSWHWQFVMVLLIPCILWSFVCLTFRWARALVKWHRNLTNIHLKIICLLCREIKDEGSVTERPPVRTMKRCRILLCLGECGTNQALRTSSKHELTLRIWSSSGFHIWEFQQSTP